MHVIEVFQRSVARHGDRPFLRDVRDQVTYAQADAASSSVATLLRRRGVAPNDPVALMAPDQVGMWLAVIAVWKLGAIPAMIDPRTPLEVLPYFVASIGARLHITTHDGEARLRQAGADRVVGLEELTANTVGGADSVHGEESPLFLSYTSGTTGKPKGALLASSAVTLGTACTADRLGLRSEDLLLATTPASSSFQLVAAVLPAIHAGAGVGLVAGSTAERIWQVAQTWGATVLIAYPLTLADVVNAKGVSRGVFRMAQSGGSPVAPRIKRDYLDRLGIPLMESYGQSEFGGFMALGHPDQGERSLDGYAGRPLPDRYAYVGGPDGVELPAGRVGEVMVPHGYFSGYWHQDDKTAETLAGGRLHTGDLALADRNNYLKVLGRVGERDSAQRRGGFLRQVEDVLYDHPATKHAAAVNLGDGDVGAFVELLPDGQRTLDLAGFIQERVPAGLAPPRVQTVDAMPRTFSGKVDRQTLAAEPRR